MNRVQPIYDITLQIQTLIEHGVNATNRQTVMDEINTLLIQRGEYMEHMVEPYTNEELELGKKLLPMNQEVQQNINLLFSELKTEMKQMKKQKHSNRKYTNPYENVQTVDGMFMDKKK